MLKGKTALITGGARGIGAAITATLAAQGANVAVIYAGSQEKAEALCAQCAQDHGVHAQAYQCDVADFAAAKAVVAQVKKDFGTVDVLVNNAGITQDGLLAMMKEESFDRVLDVDLKGAFNFIRHCTPLFLRQKGGAIVNITSVSGTGCGFPGHRPLHHRRGAAGGRRHRHVKKENTHGTDIAQSGGDGPGGHHPRGQHRGGDVGQPQGRRPRHRPHHPL